MDFHFAFSLFSATELVKVCKESLLFLLQTNALIRTNNESHLLHNTALQILKISVKESMKTKTFFLRYDVQLFSPLIVTAIIF